MEQDIIPTCLVSGKACLSDARKSIKPCQCESCVSFRLEVALVKSLKSDQKIMSIRGKSGIQKTP